MMMRSITSRCFSTAIKFTKNGQAAAVLKSENYTLTQKLGSKDVLVKMLAAPINPADINMVEGVYGITAKLPAVGGSEGVGQVSQIGSDVKSLKVGDWVIPSVPGFGTWRQDAVADESSFLQVPNDIPKPYAATIAVNPCTAYRLLRDFVSLKPGDVIIQNGANSMVGLAVIQMARDMGVRTINIVRSDRPNTEKVLQLLTNYGGDINIPDTYVNSTGFKDIIADLPPIKLAFNCIGGDVIADMARNLGNNATIVTYGSMSKKSLSLPADVVNYKQLSLKGFWISSWNSTHSIQERKSMVNDIANMIRTNHLSFLYELHDLDDFDYALSKHNEPFYLRKVILDLDYPDRFKEHDALPESEYEAFETMAV